MDTVTSEATEAVEEQQQHQQVNDDDDIPDIEFEEAVFDLDFHPTQPYIAAALITGGVYM